jgi:DNA-directed RNA polymerase specialized sigma24 family protein
VVGERPYKEIPQSRFHRGNSSNHYALTIRLAKARIYSLGQPAKPLRKDDDLLAEALLPHLDPAYNFARYLARNEHHAADVVQEAFLRARRYGVCFTGQNPRTRLFIIVRNTFFSMRKRNIPAETAVQFDEGDEGERADLAEPEVQMRNSADARIVTEALDELSVEFARLLSFANSKTYPIRRLRE